MIGEWRCMRARPHDLQYDADHTEADNDNSSASSTAARAAGTGFTRDVAA